MAFDGILINALTEEVKAELLLGKVDKIYQPDRNTLVFNIRRPQKTYKLLLSNHPQTARFNLTEEKRTNPQTPPLFCMVLRKHLENGILIDIKQDGLERIVSFVFENYNELGEKVKLCLVGEFMGRHSNLILINPETNIILDSIRRVNENISQFREVLPGLDYSYPPAQDKLQPSQITEELLIEKLLDEETDKRLDRALLSLISGISPQTAREIAIRAKINPKTNIEFLGQYDYENIYQSIKNLGLFLENKTYQPTMVFEDEKPLAFAPFDLELFADFRKEKYPSLSLLVEDFIGKKETSNALQQKAMELEKVLNKNIKRCEKNYSLQEKKLLDGKNSEQYRIWGELLTANLYHLEQGKTAEVKNFYSEEEETIKIPLDPQITPNENAQKYFKKYNKAKNAVIMAKQQMKKINFEKNYLESILESLNKSENLDDIKDIRAELEDEDYLKKKISKKNKKQEEKSSPLEFSKSGFKIFVGKNNKQNDYVTLKLARSDDLWLHTKDIPGSHVIVRNPERREFPEEVISFAANLAAYFSQARASSLVPVDYTLKKYVKKPKGAKAGMVYYEKQQSIYITPDKNLIE